MIKTRSMTRKQNNADACSRKRMKTCDYMGGVPWSDLNLDVLYSVMMRLGVVEFISFTGVCKSWRSLALSNWKRFMESRPPMAMLVSENTCYLEDFEGREFKTNIPHSVGRKCVGLTCGYLILFGEKTCDFWLVNLITRHELHFPDVPSAFNPEKKVRAVLVFSPSVNGWVFVMMNRPNYELWFSIAGGKGAWNHVSTTDLILDLHAFKGKIYTLHVYNSPIWRRVCELRLDPVPKLTVLGTDFLESVMCVLEFISSDENLYLLEYMSRDTYKVHRLRFDEPTCVPCEKTRQECVLFHSQKKFRAIINPESWAVLTSSQQHGSFFDTYKRVKDRFYVAKMWYFPHDCLNVTHIDK